MMRSPVALLLLVVVPVVSSAQANPRQAGALRSEPKTWTTPFEKDARPRDPFADQKGRVWFVGQQGNFVAYLDPEKNDFKRYTIDEGTHPHNLVVDAKGFVWFTGNTNGRIVRLDPATGKTTNYMMPDSAIKDPHTMTFNREGDAWFTAQTAGVVGKLTVSDGKIRIWKLTSGYRPYGIWLDSHERPWFDEFGTNKIGTIDPKTGELKEYPLPNDRTRPRRIAITSDDQIWYGDYTRGMLGHLDPKTGAVEEFPTPSGAVSLPYGMTLDDRGRIWVAETGVQPNKIQAFDPRKKTWVESVTIAADGPNTIRHMTFDHATRSIWFGGDANMIGRVKVAPEPVVP
jgi:virginiamycin B lyase